MIQHSCKRMHNFWLPLLFISFLLFGGLASCVHRPKSMFQLKPEVLIEDGKGATVLAASDVQEVRITYLNGVRTLDFRLQEPAIMRFMKLETGIKLTVKNQGANLTSFDVSHGIGEGKGGYVFSINDIFLGDGSQLSSVILYKP